jgi:GMP synthase-like glutamine amidotransferase
MHRCSSAKRLVVERASWQAAAMTIGILETGRLPAELQAQWSTYVDMIRTMLGHDRDYRSYDVQAGELPVDPAECAAYVITGSSARVYEDCPWISPLLEFIRTARGRAKLVGICFGHQAMAKAFGGEVTKSSKGWGLGMHRYEIVGPPPGMVEPLGLAIPAFHQDQVTTLPPGARVLAASRFTPFAAMGYDDDTVSVQGHPEFSPAFSAALIEARRDVYGPLANSALLLLLQPDDGGRTANWLRRFIDGSGLDAPG